MLQSGQKAHSDSEARIEPTTTWFGSLQSSTQQLSTGIYRTLMSLKLHINQELQKREILAQKEVRPKTK